LKYYDWIDNIIFDQLDKNGYIQFNEILRIINKDNNKPQKVKEITKATLSEHLRRMISQNIIFREPHLQGSKGSYKYTGAGNILRKLGMIVTVANERDGYDFDERNHPEIVLRKILRKTLYAKGIGVTKIVNQAISNSGKVIINEIRRDRSFSEQDIMNNQPGSTNIEFSSNVKIKQEDVRDIIHFCKNQLRILDPAFSDASAFNMTEFNNIYKPMQKYLSICSEMSAYVIIILQLIWTHIRKYKRPELIWYFETLGQDRLLYFLEYELKKNKNDAKEIIQNNSNLKRKHIKEIIRRVSVYSHLITVRQKELHDLLNKISVKYHPMLNLINDLSYPKFMRDLHSSLQQ
jgi:DNA-binding HxlR family transcriptional regulator